MSATAPVERTERPVQLDGSRLARLALRSAGWRLQFDGLPARQGVAVIYPHTSNWDFVVGVLAKWAIGLPVTFWGKASLFEVPLFGRWLRGLGGLPVQRHVPQGAVGQAIAAMRAACRDDRFMWLALAPEGTRGPAAGWRSGFYRVALQAQVPVGLVRLDYGRRVVGFDSFWQLCGDARADLATFAARLADCRGLQPLRAAPVRLIEPRAPRARPRIEP